jgi:peptidoglycan/LPS O-acetylase OafA/YrhL
MKERRSNNIGIIRLILASAVIIGHSPEMIDGSHENEPLSVIFHTMSLGGVAVDFFFLLSGYLITKSMISAGAVRPYVTRRILRIWPAYAVAFFLSVFCLSPLVGGAPWTELLPTFASLATMRDPPIYPGQLKGLPYPVLNGSMWTIAYEFRCYILVAVLFEFGILRHRWICFFITVTFVLTNILINMLSISSKIDSIRPFHLNLLIGDASRDVRLTAIFLVGACIYLFWDMIFPILKGWVVVCCWLAATLLLFVPLLAETGIMTFGAIVLFWAAFSARIGVLQQINDRWDISYGTYLYGWPVAITILYFHRHIGPAALAATALIISWGCGAASWWGLEKWTKGPSKRTLS